MCQYIRGVWVCNEGQRVRFVETLMEKMMCTHERVICLIQSLRERLFLPSRWTTKMKCGYLWSASESERHFPSGDWSRLYIQGVSWTNCSFWYNCATFSEVKSTSGHFFICSIRFDNKRLWKVLLQGSKSCCVYFSEILWTGGTKDHGKPSAIFTTVHGL